MNGHIDYIAHAKAEQDSFLYPRIHAPAGFGGSVGFGRADGAGIERRAEVLEEVEVVFGVSLGTFVEEAFDLSLHERCGRRAAPESPEHSRFCRGWARP